MKKVLLSVSSIILIVFSITSANSQTKATSDNEAKKRQILRNIAIEAKKPSPDVQKRLMLRSIAKEVRKPQYIKFLNILPEAIEIDESLKSANLTYQASVDDAKASRSAIFPKATLTATGQE